MLPFYILKYLGLALKFITLMLCLPFFPNNFPNLHLYIKMGIKTSSANILKLAEAVQATLGLISNSQDGLDLQLFSTVNSSTSMHVFTALVGHIENELIRIEKLLPRLKMVTNSSMHWSLQ